MCKLELLGVNCLVTRYPLPYGKDVCSTRRFGIPHASRSQLTRSTEVPLYSSLPSSIRSVLHANAEQMGNAECGDRGWP